jgi:hypothetical protein
VSLGILVYYDLQMESNTNSDSFSDKVYFTKMHCSGLIVEHRRLRRALSVELAGHMSIRYSQGRIAVVTSGPQALMSSVCKQWIRLIRLTQRDQARTLNLQRRNDLAVTVHAMQSLSFTAKDPASDPLGGVSFATVEQFILTPPVCATLYITEPIAKLSQHMLVTWMRPGGRVVIYDE